MKIGVISDTHIPVFANKLPEQISSVFKNCDLIVHAGDIVGISVIKELEKLAPVKAVWGNMDEEEVKKNLPKSIVFEAEGKAIGVIHGRGKGHGPKAIEEIKKFFKEKLDIIIFGHSHIPFNEKIDGTLFFNPGSATDRVFSQDRFFGVIEIVGDSINAEIIRVE